MMLPQLTLTQSMQQNGLRLINTSYQPQLSLYPKDAHPEGTRTQNANFE
jgi:hypothetical protein